PPTFRRAMSRRTRMRPVPLVLVRTTAPPHRHLTESKRIDKRRRGSAARSLEPRAPVCEGSVSTSTAEAVVEGGASSERSGEARGGSRDPAELLFALAVAAVPVAGVILFGAVEPEHVLPLQALALILGAVAVVL